MLANGTNVTSPLSGCQLIPINAVASASSSANSENSGWLQGSSGCNNAIVSSDSYFCSTEYMQKIKCDDSFLPEHFGGD